MCAVFGLAAAHFVTEASDSQAAEDASAPPTPVRVDSRLRDLGTRWLGEVVSTTFCITNASRSPLELVSRVSRCDDQTPFALLDHGRKVRFAKRDRVTVAPQHTLLLGTEITVTTTGSVRDDTLDCIAIQGPRSWPIRLTVRHRGIEMISAEPPRLDLRRHRAGSIRLRSADGSAFAPVIPSGPTPPLWTFATADDSTCTVWTVQLIPRRYHDPSGQGVVDLEVHTADARTVHIQVPVLLGR